MTNLNSEQLTAYKGIMENKGKSLLTAKGGCGKTYLTAKLVIAEAQQGTHLTIIAPSHTARSVLEKEITNQCNGDHLWLGYRERIATMTVASALGKRPDYSKSPKNYRDTPFVINKKLGRINDNKVKGDKNLLIVEEISMVGKQELEAIFSQWGDRNPMLMVGDFRQIPPVNAMSSRGMLGKLFNTGRLKHFKLVKNERSSKDTDIAKYSDLIYDNKGEILQGDYRGVETYDSIEKFEEAFDEAVKQGHCTAIAYSNRKVNKYMEMGSGSNEVDISSGDFVRLHEGITVSYQDGEGKWVKDIVANNGDIVKVLDFTPNVKEYIHPLCKTPIKFGTITLDIMHPVNFGEYIQLKIPANIDDGVNAGKNGSYGALFSELLNKVKKAGVDLDAGKEDSKTVMEFYEGIGNYDRGVKTIFDSYDRNLAKDKELRCKRKRDLLYGRCFFGVRSEFTNVTKLYSLTAHKSQGQSIDTVFADLRDIGKAKTNERKHLAYVACSRAINNLHVLS